uniref:Alpha-xenorhabdolysin family binary toxin subunit B n=1 Tax=Angiostrongylus cantonensis TaxID=6313 RepID=A0A158P828_ANGCA
MTSYLIILAYMSKPSIVDSDASVRQLSVYSPPSLVLSHQCLTEPSNPPRLFDWIEGPGEKWLLTLHEIGENKDEARQLVKEHQQLALKSKEIIAQADDLADLASRLMAAVPAHSITLEKAREQVRGLARQYANRVERQTGMARQSEEFHTRLTRKTDVLLESLCTDLMMNDLAAVESEKNNLEEKVAAMEKMYESVTACGASFIDDLSAEEVNSHGKRLVRSYMAGVVHVREQLSAARERRKRCLELVDVRRLKLQQFTQLFTCENDAQQVLLFLAHDL